MSSLALRYVVALAVLFAAYGIYALAAVPLIEPEARFKAADSSGPAENDLAEAAMRRQRDELRGLFADGDWELSSPKVLATEQGKLLFRDYKPLPDGRIELTPCTLVFFAGGNENHPGRPIVMRAPAGAALHFDRPLHLGQAEIGRLLGGRMLGEISIRGPESRPGANDALEIDTRNVQLNEERIWTPHEVRFRYGPSHGSGRDLTIAFLPRGKDRDSKKSSVSLGAGGLRSIELVHVDKLHLVSASGELLPGDGAPRDASPGHSQPPLPVEVTCRGPFRFEFAKLVASCEDQVAVHRLHPDGSFDSLECQLLELYFAKDAGAPASASPPSAGNSSFSSLSVQRLVAVGGPVVLRAGAGGASATGQRLEYDLQTRRILLEDSRKAKLVHERYAIEARGVAYELGEPGRLGRLWASGPGVFRAKREAPGEPAFEASWGHELRLRPHQEQHVISLTKDATLAYSGQGQIRAAEIHVWLKEAPRAESVGAPAKAGGPPEIAPNKMLAVGNVEIESPRLSGKSPRLEAWFKSLERSVPEDARSETIGPESRPASNGLVRVAAPDAAAEPEGKQPQKLHLTGNLIQLQILRQGEGASVENVTVDGNVRLVELQPPGIQELPLQMRGDTLTIFEAASADARARIIGQPARVEARGIRLSAANLQLHRGENRIWIDGPGEMILPAESRRHSGVAFAGEPKRASGAGLAAMPGQPVTVTWQQRMNFDGQNIRFEKQVEARSESQFARGEILEIALNRRLDFAEPRPKEQIEVARLAFDGGVYIEQQAIENRLPAALERMQVRKLSIDNASGRLHAVGPGWVSSVRRGQAASFSGPAASRGAANRSFEELQYLHIDFQTALTGNMVNREIQFLDRVTAVYGPIQDWEQQLSKERVEDLPEKGVLMNCDRLRVAEMGMNGNGQKFYEMEAAGNSRVEGQTFTATADRMTYSQAKELIVLEGDGRADAELWRQARAGGPTEHAAARKILYWQRENRAQVDDARFLDLSQFGTPPPRESPRK